MEGYEVKRIESVIHTADIFVTATGNKDIIMANNMKKMKNNEFLFLEEYFLFLKARHQYSFSEFLIILFS